MIDRADQSLLPGAPLAGSDREPKGEYAIDLAISRIGHVPVDIEKLWDVDECPENLLPWLAWGLSVDSWDPDATVDEKRALIKANKTLHKKKGTIGAVKTVLSDAGYPNAKIQEGIGQIRRDGTFHRTGLIHRNSDGHWAFYRIILSIGDPEISASVLDLVSRVAPERCKLFEVIYE